MRNSCYLKHGIVIIQIWNVPEQLSPDADIVEHYTHPSSGQRMPHVVGVSQKQDSCQGVRQNWYTFLYRSAFFPCDTVLQKYLIAVRLGTILFIIHVLTVRPQNYKILWFPLIWHL